jgi:nicotinamidase-related amidase
MDSGYTEGTVGFGLDAIGMLGFKLDSGDGTAGSGLLVPDRTSGGSQDYSSDLAVAGKVKLSKSTLRAGSMQFKNMAIASSDSRLTPQVFKGGQLISQEIDGLTLDGGYLREVNHRNSGDFEDMAITSGGRRGITTTGGTQTDSFQFLGGSYKLTQDLTAAYYHSNLEDLYKQNSFNLVHVLPLADKQTLKTDLRYARSTDDGRSNVDNKALGAMLTYGLGGHSFGLGYQKMSGDTGFAYINGTDPFLVNYVQISDFANKDEQSWQARYDFNFASIGKARNIQSVLVCGVATNVCVETTARDAYIYDYYVTMIDDCSAAYEAKLHLGTLENIRRHFGLVASSSEIIDTWRGLPRQTAGL